MKPFQQKEKALTNKEKCYIVFGMPRNVDMEHGLTLKTLAQRLSKKFGVEQRKIAPTLATWTNLGVLKTEGNVHDGSGNYRTFCEDELFKAALIYELFFFTVSIRILKSVRRLLDRQLKKNPTILKQARDGQEWYFVVSRYPHSLDIPGIRDDEDTAIYGEFMQKPYNEKPWGKIAEPRIKGDGVSRFLSLHEIRVDYMLKDL